MQAIDRERVQELTADLEAVLLKFGADHGVIVSVGGICFYEPDQAPNRSPIFNPDLSQNEVNGQSSVFEVESSQNEVAGPSPVFKPETPNNEAEGRFASQAAHWGLSPLDYGKMVILNGRVCKLVDIRSRCYKYPIIAETASGTRYRHSAKSVCRALQNDL